MKLKNIILIASVAILAVSCYGRKDDYKPFLAYNATVTFRPQADGSYYLRQDDSTALIVLNEQLQEYPFKTEKRALIQYRFDENEQNGNKVDGYKFTKNVTLTYLDTLLTKIPEKYDAAKEATYGDAPVGMYIDPSLFPTTMIEDGYLNVCFVIPVGTLEKPHTITLLTGVNPNDPYEVELRHNSNDDDMYSEAFCMAAFPLKDLPDTGGKTVKLTLKWNSLVTGSISSTQFDYCSRTDW